MFDSAKARFKDLKSLYAPPNTFDARDILDKFWVTFFEVFKLLNAFIVLGASTSPKKLTPVFAAVWNFLALSTFLRLLTIFLLALNILPTVNELLIALPTLPILNPVRVIAAASAAGFKPPWIAATPNKASSSKATLPRIPVVYAKFNPVFCKKGITPSLDVEPISKAFSYSSADWRSAPVPHHSKSPDTQFAKFLYPDIKPVPVRFQYWSHILNPSSNAVEFAL